MLNYNTKYYKKKGFEMKERIMILLLFPVILFSLEIRGKIFHRETQKPISEAVIIVRSSSGETLTARSEKDGSFVIKELEEGNYELEIKFIGFYPEKRNLALKKNESISLYLSPLPTASLGEIEVKGEREKQTASKTSVDKKTLQKATASITGDPLEVVTKMPGVESHASDDFATAAKISIRGGKGYETAGLFDGFQLNYFYHRVISDSIFIDDLIEEITLYKGVAPVEYGQIMSGLIDTKTIKPPTGFHGKANFGLLNTYLTLYGATDDEKWQWLWGIRRTHYDLVLGLFLQQSDTLYFNLPYYVDSQGKLTYNGENDKVSIFYVFSLEPIKISNLGNKNSEEKTNLFYGAADFTYFTGGLEWKHIFSSEFFVVQQISGAINYQKTTLGLSSNEAHLKSSDNNLRYKITANYYPFEEIGLKTGFETTYYPDLFYKYQIKGIYTNIVTQQAEFTNFMDTDIRTNSLILSGFFGGEFELFSKKILLQPGIRINYFNYIDKFSYDPRFTLEYRINGEHKLYASVGYLSQLPTEPYIIGLLIKDKSKIEVPAAWHYVIGEKSKFLDYWEISVEGYLKHYVNVISRVSNIELQFKTSDNRLDIYGAEILLKKNPGGIPIYGWLSGSIMNSWTYVTEGTDPNNFAGFSFSPDNQGNFNGGINPAWKYATPPLNEWFNYWKYKFNITVVWEFLKNWSLTSEVSYESGSYYTPVERTENITIGSTTIYIPKYGKYLSEKMPDSHQLNLKLEWNPTIFGLPWGFYAQVINIYNYRPVYYYNYNEDYTEKKPVQSPIGIYGFGGFWIKW